MSVLSEADLDSSLISTYLFRLAAEELLKEAERAAKRVESEGPMGWVNSKKKKGNAAFLQKIVIRNMVSNKLRTHRKSKGHRSTSDKPKENGTGDSNTKEKGKS